MHKRNDDCQNKVETERRHSSQTEAGPSTRHSEMDEEHTNRRDNRNREGDPREESNAREQHTKKRRHAANEAGPSTSQSEMDEEQEKRPDNRKRKKDLRDDSNACKSPKKKRRHAVDANTEDEETQLIEIYNRKKDIIKEDVEPLLVFNDDRNLKKEFGELHKELQNCKECRVDRILIFIRYLDRMPDEDKIKILKAMSIHYESIFKDGDDIGASGYTALQEPIVPQMDMFPIQATTPHEFTDSDIQRAEGTIEATASTARGYNIDDISEFFRKARIQSLILQFCGLSRNEILRLQNFCNSMKARIWVFSVLDEFSVNVLNHKGVTEATMQVYIDDAHMKFEEIDCRCFCVIDRVCIRKYTELFRLLVNEIKNDYIDMLIESKVLSDELTPALERIKMSSNESITQHQILSFLLQDDLPDVCFCMLENTIKAKGGNLDLIHNIMQESTSGNDDERRERRECIRLIGLSKKDEKSVKEKQRVEKLSRNHCQALKSALVSSYGDIVDDLEPLLLLKYFKKEDAKTLQPLLANKGKRRRERVTIFLQRILKDDTNELVTRLIVVMKLHYRKSLKAVLDILEKGSKCEHYRCPKLKGPVLVHSTNINLLDPGKARIELKPKPSCDTYKDDITETANMRLCLVKVYYLMKEEMERSTVNSIAVHLKNHGLISESKLQTITECSRRRETVDMLLRQVLCGATEMQEQFRLALGREMSYLAEALNTESASTTDIKKFTLLEEARRGQQMKRMLLTQRQCNILLKTLENENKLGQLNDQLLSTLTFSISEHNEIEALPFDLRAQKLIDTMMTCSPMAFLQVCGILNEIGLPNVAKTLMTSDTDHTKDQDPSQTANADYQFLEPSLEEIVVSAISRSRQSPGLTKTNITMRLLPSDTSLQEYTKDIGFILEHANRESSIVLSLSPKGENSWHNLEMKCRSGKIKDFIPAVFHDISTDYFKEGQYKLKLTIYALPSSKEPWMETAYVCLENESEERSKEMKEFIRVMHEELEVTYGLLNRLKDGGIIDDTILEKVSSKQRRSQKVEFLLKEIMSNGTKGFEVLKESLKETNTYLYNYIYESEKAHLFTDLFGSTLHKGGKEIFFTCTVILSVKRKETSGDPGSSKSDLEISCPEMIDPVYMFKDKGKISKPDREVLSTESSLKESKAEKREEKGTTDNQIASTSSEGPEVESKFSVGKPEKEVSKETTIEKDVSVERVNTFPEPKHTKRDRKAKSNNSEQKKT